ncbi:MAG: hypothetical protein EPN53_15260 [Acidobacteria bacterium]|nr:MAG: hypothetical protein EPN53_15260 [Acidobacteriota bacterium]
MAFGRRCVVALLATLAAAPPAALAAGPRPRIGLVLSGGGALGIAHVGVLQALEEMHVPVDVVAGTSMGAIVGGLYAAGYSPAELEQVVATLDWRELLRDRPDRRRLPFRRKVDDLTYLTRYELGISDGKLRMPGGFISGHRLGVALRVLSLRAAGVTDFDRLPLPFRAVATDLDTGEMVVLAQGDLATALRASMAVPGIFAPVEVGGRLLADGGMVRNLPVDVARAMGADIVIAVDVGEPLAAKARPDSITTVIEKTVGMLTRLNVESSLRDADIVIRPDVARFGLLDFQQWRAILPRGGDAARAEAGLLAAFALPPDEWNAHVACQRRETAPLRISQLSVDPGPGQPPELVARLVRTRPGRTLDAGVLQADVERLYELGEFETVDFHIDPDGSDWALAISARPKGWGPNFLRFGVALSADLEGSSEFNALASLTMTRLNRLGGELKAWTQLGSAPLMGAQFDQPLETSRTLFATVAAQGSQVKQQVPIGAESVQYRISVRRAVAGLGLELGRYGEIRAVIRRDETDALPTSHHGGDAPRVEHTDSGLALAASFDQMDNVSFPKHGVLAFAELYDARAALGSDDVYRRLDVSAYGAVTAGRSTLLGLAKYTSALGGTLPIAQQARLGGLFNLSGLPPGELAGSYGGMAGLIYLYRIGRLPSFGEGIYAGCSIEAGNLWTSGRDVTLSDLRRSYSVVVGADTALGPVYFAQGFTSGGKDSYYLLIGRTF